MYFFILQYMWVSKVDDAIPNRVLVTSNRYSGRVILEHVWLIFKCCRAERRPELVGLRGAGIHIGPSIIFAVKTGLGRKQTRCLVKPG